MPALTSGTHLGPYEIVSLIGQGGMGEVYRARDTRLNRTVAIKVLPQQIAEDSELKQRFEREAQVIASLNHPHICTLHDVGHQEGMLRSGGFFSIPGQCDRQLVISASQAKLSASMHE